MSKSVSVHHIYNYGRGNVIVAPESAVTLKQDEFGIVYYSIDRCATIRVWATKHGLSELCVRGPLSGTTLDACPTHVDVPIMALHDRRACVEDASAKFAKAIDIAFAQVLGA
jgi:hypothetical protein